MHTLTSSMSKQTDVSQREMNDYILCSYPSGFIEDVVSFLICCLI